MESSSHFGETYEVQNENIMAGLLEFKNGVFGTVMFNGNCIFPEKPFLSIQGTEGILYLPDSNFFGGKVILQKQFTPDEEELKPVNSYFENERGIGVSEMMLAFEKGDMSFGPKGMAVNALEVLEGITKSSQSRQFIKMISSF
jgi:predicted dehydrogenase